jgi:flavin-dependent dehydrogenase
MTESFDIAVVGGGPAGAITSLCLSRMGWHVGVIERTAFDRERFGETLPPEVNPVLRGLGLWEAFLTQEPLESPGIVSTWGSGIPVEVDFAANAFGCGWHIDRNRFDKVLCQQAAASGARLFLHRNAGWTARDCAWQLEGLQAKLLVNATGRSGLMLDKASDLEREDALLSIVFRISDEKRASRDQRTWIETAPAGWWYSTLLADGTGVAMFFTGAEIYREHGISIGEQLVAAPLTRARLNSGRASQPRIVYVPSGRLKDAFGTNWIAVGDSASSYDPLSGNGILKALRHGEAAARAINGHLRGDTGAMERYASQVRLEFETYSQQRRRFYSSERRWAGHPFWARRSE